MESNTILIVDDEDEVLRLLDVELSSEGYQVMKACSGEDAIRKTYEFLPDLIVMDILMPDMNGAQAIRLLKSKSRTKNIPVIFLTAVLTKEEERNERLGVTVGGESFPAIAKPFNSRDLINRIDGLLHKPRETV